MRNFGRFEMFRKWIRRDVCFCSSYVKRYVSY